MPNIPNNPTEVVPEINRNKNFEMSLAQEQQTAVCAVQLLWQHIYMYCCIRRKICKCCQSEHKPILCLIYIYIYIYIYATPVFAIKRLQTYQT